MKTVKTVLWLSWNAWKARRQSQKLYKEANKWLKESMLMKQQAELLKKWYPDAEEATNLMKDAVYLVNYSRQCMEKSVWFRQNETMYREELADLWADVVTAR